MPGTLIAALVLALTTAADAHAKLIGSGGGASSSIGAAAPAPSGRAGDGVFLGALLIVAIAVVLVRRPHADRR